MNYTLLDWRDRTEVSHNCVDLSGRCPLIEIDGTKSLINLSACRGLPAPEIPLEILFTPSTDSSFFGLGNIWGNLDFIIE
jgi:hypothetical protein